jgi:predicted metallopeptidase
MFTYPTVIKRSKNAGLLERLHSIKVTEEAARQVVFDYLDEQEVEEVRFTGTSGRAICRLYSKERCMLRYPREDTGKLNLYLVLHEIAHFIAYQQFGEKAHGDIFVNVLDDLAMSEWMWKSGAMDE